MGLKNIRLVFFSLVLAWCTAFGQVRLPQLTPAATPTSSPADTNTLAVTLQQRLAEARADLETAVAMSQAGVTNTPPGVTPKDVWARRAGLNRLVRLYEQESSNAEMLEKVKTQKAEITRQAQTWTRFPDAPPYSILLTDSLRQEIQGELQGISNSEATIGVLDQLIEENRIDLKQAEERIRQINEQLESAKDPFVAAGLSWQRDFEKMRSQVAAASIATSESERLVQQEMIACSRIHLGLLRQQLLVAEPAAIFTQDHLDKATGLIEQKREQLERELSAVQARRAAAAQALSQAREEFRAAQGPGTPGALRAAEIVSLREAQLDGIDTTIYVLRLLLDFASVERTMWEMRFAVHHGRSAKILAESALRLKAFNRRLDLSREHARQQLAGASDQLQVQDGRITSLPQESDLLPLARERLTALRDQGQALLRLVRGVDHLERLTRRWSEELRDAETKLPFTGRVQTVFSDAGLFLGRLWNFEVFSAEDTITVDGQKITGKRSVTVGKVVMALLILVVGYWLTGLVTRFAEPVIVKRLKIEPNQADLIRRWLRAFLVLCLVIFSLISVKIPLTIFAFAGGALAIGLGFGMQTVLKNFVSGLILLFERPFRVGDVLDIGGQRGAVTSIGLRASILQLWDGTETLIPNSTLLESNVTNWTYTNRKVRFTVSVGVAYGTDPRHVIQLLSEVADRHGLVEKDPKPQVLFTDFAESTLNFELRFWVDVLKANSAQISSDLRLMIAGAFADHKICIAFPQRDLHLHAAQSLPVHVVPAELKLGDLPGGTAEKPKVIP